MIQRLRRCPAPAEDAVDAHDTSAAPVDDPRLRRCPAPADDAVATDDTSAAPVDDPAAAQMI